MKDKDSRSSVYDIQLSGDDWLKAHNIHRFSHAAMATTFEIFIANGDKNYAAQAAQAAFARLDGLEEELSRFIDNSDISRINHLNKDQSIIIGPDAFDCLDACLKLYHREDLAVNLHAALRDGRDPGEHLEEGGLARPVAADDAYHLALHHLEELTVQALNQPYRFKVLVLHGAHSFGFRLTRDYTINEFSSYQPQWYAENS